MRDCNICSTSLGLMHCAYVVIQIDCMCRRVRVEEVHSQRVFKILMPC